jgi:nucleotide-binding universal stress UspA family protein
MAFLNTVLCALDFSDLGRSELQLATEVCEAFGAQLVLHHNLSNVPPGITRAWEWNEVHRGDEFSTQRAEERMREILAELPKSVQAQASVSSGPLGPVLLQLAEAIPADLVILGSHGWSTADHASVAERILDRCPCPVLTVNEAAEAVSSFRLRPRGQEPIRVAVATDLSASGRWPVEYAFELARSVPIELDLVHIVPADSPYELTSRRRRDLEVFAPLDLVERLRCYVRSGDAVEELLDFTRGNHSNFLIAGDHARSFFRRYFTHDTARDVLHRATCPVWFVPPKRA